MLIALGLSPVMMAQSYDDLYYNPNKKDTSLRKEEKKQVTEKKRTYVSTNMPVVVISFLGQCAIFAIDAENGYSVFF